MIRCNLSILLAERALKITNVSNDTGISRTTLTALSSNNSQGLQFETLNTLCLYLGVTPNELISFIPYDIKFTRVSKMVDNEQYQIDISIHEKAKSIDCNFYINAYIEKDFDGNFAIVVADAYLFENAGSEIDHDLERENLLIKKVISSMPISFLKDFKLQIINELRFAMNLEESVPYEINFSDDFKN